MKPVKASLRGDLCWIVEALYGVKRSAAWAANELRLIHFGEIGPEVRIPVPDWLSCT
jgi:hypothetical protein